MTVSSDFEKLH